MSACEAQLISFQSIISFCPSVLFVFISEIVDLTLIALMKCERQRHYRDAMYWSMEEIGTRGCIF